MKIKLRIIEFSSDIFSNSVQLKDLFIMPLFSKYNFEINIFEAISQNKDYIINLDRQVIKLGLFNCKTLLGVGNLYLNKISQKIIFSEDGQVIKNDYFLTVECIINNVVMEQIKKDKLIKYEKRRNKSMENYININNSQILKTENKNFFKKKKIHSDIDIKSKRKNNISGNNSHKEIKKYNNNFIVKGNNNINKILFSNKNIIKNSNLSLSTKNQSSNRKKLKISNFSKEKKNLIFPSIDLLNLKNIYSHINEMNNKLFDDNIFSQKNENEFLVELKNFFNKIDDIFLFYTKISKNIIEGNQRLKNFIKFYHNMMKMILKKDNNLKIKLRNIEFNDILFKNRNDNSLNKINNINNKLSLIKNIKNDGQFLIQNIINKRKTKLKEIYDFIINKENKKKNYKIIQDFIKEMKSNNNEMNIERIDINELKNKIDKLKEQYINKTNKKENKYKKRIPKNYRHSDKKNSEIKRKKLNIEYNQFNCRINNDKFKAFSPNIKQRNKMKNK